MAHQGTSNAVAGFDHFGLFRIACGFRLYRCPARRTLSMRDKQNEELKRSLFILIIIAMIAGAALVSFWLRP